MSIQPNSPTAVRQRAQTGNISRSWPFLMLVFRGPFAVFIEAIFAFVFSVMGYANPWRTAASWWLVSIVLVNIGTLVLLALITQREGIRLLDLISFQRTYLRKDILLGLVLFPLSLAIAVLGTILSSLLIYGNIQQFPTFVDVIQLWAAIVSLLFLPISVAFAEQMTYFGYALPRIEALTGKTVVAWLLVALAFSV